MADSVLVVGGGIAGLTAAETLANMGIDVHLVEKKGHLGGNAFNWACMATDICQNCGACLVAKTANQLPQMQHVTIHLKSSLSSITKQEKGFSAVIDGGTPARINVDKILLATGMTPYDPSELISLKYGVQQQVITTVDLNRLLKKDQLSEFLAEKPDPKIAFVQCVGSRNRERGRDYCSQVCCKTAVRDAIKLTHLYPQSQITIFNLDLQVIGKEFRTQLKEACSRVEILQGVPAEILTGKEKNMLTVIREDDTGTARVAHHFDLIVLAVGMLPSDGITELASALEAGTDAWGFFGASDATIPEGVYTAGAANGPMDILSAGQQGVIAANKIAMELKTMDGPSLTGNIAVWGSGVSARRTATALAGDDCQVFLLDPGKGAAVEHESIHHLPEIGLTSIEGTAGQFMIHVVSEDEPRALSVKAVVIAEDVAREPVEDPHLDVLGPRVKTLSEFLEISTQAPDDIPARVAFRVDHSGHEWKAHSRQALVVAKALADSNREVSFLMNKMLVHGLEGQRLYDEARSQGVSFLRVSDGSEPFVEAVDDGIMIKVHEATLPDVELMVACDWIVVPERVVPVGSNNDISAALRLDPDREGFFQPANVRHRLINSPRRGIYFVGTGHDEVDDEDFTEELDALKAALGELSQEQDNLESNVAIREGKCVKCLTCYRLCPHGSITVNPQSGRPFIVPDACFQCGICVSSCPACAIEHQTGLSEDLFKQPLENHTVVFACERSGQLAAKEARENGLIPDDNFQIIPLKCAGRLSAETLIMPLIQGAARVVVAACHEGNCRSVNGNVLSAARADYLIKDMKLPASKIGFHNVAANEPAKFGKIIS